MKKLCVILLLSMLFFSSSAYAEFAGKCPDKPFKISNSFSRGVQKYTGINFFTSFIVNKVAEGNIKKQFNTKNTDIKLNMYSTGDLISGKFKNFSASIKNFSVEDFHMTDVSAKSLCAYTDLDYRTNPPKTVTPVYIWFSSVLTEDDLQKSFKSKKNADLLSNIPLMLGDKELGKLRINSLDTKIKGTKLVISSEIGFEIGFLKYNFPVAFESGIEAKNNSIYLVNFKMQPSMFGNNMEFLSQLTEIKKIKIFDLKTANTVPYQLSIYTINIKDGKVATEGTVFIPANTPMQ